MRESRHQVAPELPVGARITAPDRALCACVTDRFNSLRLPAEPSLAEWAASLNDGGHWAQIYDAAWRLVYVTDETRLIAGDTGAVSTFYLGFHRFSTEATRFWCLLSVASSCARSFVERSSWT